MDPQNFVGTIPPEIFTKIFSYLPRRDRFICMCLDPRWKEAMDVPHLWRHMSVRVDIDFFDVSTIQLTMEYCKYIKSLELLFESPEEPMQWINYKMLDITKRTYRFLSIFINKNLHIHTLSFKNFCDFYRSKKILYYLSMFLRSQCKIKVICFNGSYFSKKALIKLLLSSIALNKTCLKYLDIQNSYYESDFSTSPQSNVFSSQLMVLLGSIRNLYVLRIDLESLVCNNVLEGLLNGNCDTLEHLDIRISEHDIGNLVQPAKVYTNMMWINLKNRFRKLKVSIMFYDIICHCKTLDRILARSIPLYCAYFKTDNTILKELFTYCLDKYSGTIELVKIHAQYEILDEFITVTLQKCLHLERVEVHGIVCDPEKIEDTFRLSNFEGFKSLNYYVNAVKTNGPTTVWEKVDKINKRNYELGEFDYS